MKPDTMFYIALGAVVELFEKSDSFAEFVKLAETEGESARWSKMALKYKAKAVVGFDREMDRLVKTY